MQDKKPAVQLMEAANRRLQRAIKRLIMQACRKTLKE